MNISSLSPISSQKQWVILCWSSLIPLSPNRQRKLHASCLVTDRESCMLLRVLIAPDGLCLPEPIVIVCMYYSKHLCLRTLRILCTLVKFIWWANFVTPAGLFKYSQSLHQRSSLDWGKKTCSSTIAKTRIPSQGNSSWKNLNSDKRPWHVKS